MDSNNDQQCPVPAKYSNQDRASNSSGALTPEEGVLSYHTCLSDGKYVPVMLSPGYRFWPRDDEIIVDFLNKEINKDRPEYIRGMYPSLGKDEWYFFSGKYLNGNQPNRAAGNGYWKATGADKKILENGVRLGSKKCLVFYVGNPPKGDKTEWIMHEYVSDQPPTHADDMRLDDCVLCRIKKKSDATPKQVETEQDTCI
ncbi:NAC domain-containing protein JA2L-like isoform X2 [Henckelia pumila]|uniref:NAC domain-containing protein JA2L-like isoform X2 n=1 Tax=Henckelia pumila TaxID=405737 RepID=UPI003C6DE277